MPVVAAIALNNIICLTGNAGNRDAKSNKTHHGFDAMLVCAFLLV